MTAPRRRTLIVGVLFPLLLLVGALGVMLSTVPALPDPVAVRWGPSGLPDGVGSAGLSFVLLPVISLAYLALPLRVARGISAGPTINQRLIIVVGPFPIGTLGTLLAGSLVIQRGLEDARRGPSILPVLALALTVGLVAAVLAWVLLPPTPKVEAAPDAAELPARPLADDERALWMRRDRVGPAHRGRARRRLRWMGAQVGAIVRGHHPPVGRGARGGSLGRSPTGGHGGGCRGCRRTAQRARSSSATQRALDSARQLDTVR